MLDRARRGSLRAALLLAILCVAGASHASSPLERCALGSSAGLSTAEAAARLERCLGAERAPLRPSIESAAGIGARQPIGRPTRASAGEATAVVAVSCPSALGSPCFDDP